MLNKIKEDLELLQEFPLGITQAYCKKAREAASKALAAADEPSTLNYVYNLFDLREKIKYAIDFCSAESIVYNSIVYYPLEMLEELKEYLENSFSKPQQQENNN